MPIDGWELQRLCWWAHFRVIEGPLRTMRVLLNIGWKGTAVDIITCRFLLPLLTWVLIVTPSWFGSYKLGLHWSLLVMYKPSVRSWLSLHMLALSRWWWVAKAIWQRRSESSCCCGLKSRGNCVYCVSDNTWRSDLSVGSWFLFVKWRCGLDVLAVLSCALFLLWLSSCNGVCLVAPGMHVAVMCVFTWAAVWLSRQQG